MLIITLKDKSRHKSGPRCQGAAEYGVHLAATAFAHILYRLLPALILAAMPWTIPSAGAIEFVTRASFNVEKNNYKDYPYRVLFEKFHSSEGAEKRKIRNVIILKQVFDPEIRQRAVAAGAKFESFYGVIKAVSGDSLRLWLPESDSFKDFPVGIDRIPVENEQDYPEIAANISNYAAIVHILDKRVYKIEISFALPAPEKLEVKRQGDNNIISWQTPKNLQAPFGYRVFVNDKFYKAVSGSTVEVPRSKQQADEFFIKAVYAHQEGRIESIASPTLYDAASAQEIQKRQQAGEAYQQLAAALGQSDQPTARKLMDAKLRLLTDFLSPDRKVHILTADAFFKALDEGDRVTGLGPETPENLAEARTAYQRAADEARRLPLDFKLSEVARTRLDQNSDLATRLTARIQQESARQTLAQISADLQPGRWNQARKRLYQQQAFLRTHLDPKNKAGIEALAGVFQSIEKGDLSAGIQPVLAQHLEAALQSYHLAEKQSRTLPDNLDARFITRQRIKATTNRQASLASAEQARLAFQTWDKLLVDLNPSSWQSAKAALYANRSTLATHLPPAEKTVMAILVDFFSSLDEGDRLAASQPATMENLDTATRYYQRATQKAKTLPGRLDVGFITQLRASAVKKSKNRLQAQILHQQSDQAYNQIIAALNPTDWENAQPLLVQNEALLAAHLDADRKAIVTRLFTLFQDITAGDQMRLKRPETDSNLAQAREHYLQALDKTRSLGSSMKVTFIARERLTALTVQRADLVKRQQALMAAQQAPVPAPVPAKGPPPTVTATAAFDDRVDAKTALKLGMKAFNGQNYDLSMKYFNKAYAKQIRKLGKAGKKQSFAVLGVPPKIRAEIIFLVQLDLLKTSSGGDTDLVRDGLMEMLADIESGSGAWSIIKERKRAKISKHIDRYPF